MKESKFTEAEKRYLQDLQKLPVSIRSRILGWGLEVIPSIGLFTYGLMSERRLFVILGFLSLLYFSIWQMYGQFRGFRLLHSIYQKQLSKHDSGDS